MRELKQMGNDTCLFKLRESFVFLSLKMVSMIWEVEMGVGN
jgi:hypothetical protein